MGALLAFAIKSLLVSAVTLGLLRLARRRSASERNLVAHLGLLALLVLPLGAVVLPQLVVEHPLAGTIEATGSTDAAAAGASPPLAASSAAAAAPTDPTTIASASPATLWPLAYGLPALALLLVTLLAVARLLALRARASVLVEDHWLRAMALAQQRMNFKQGTALLASNDLASPVSWGLFSPVILLNEEAVRATGDAEAIIAHELAHVRGMDWAKLLLARVVTALHWFNPLAWLLAREAHQLREETADDAVLAADVAGPDYAQLLVGAARHECRGLLLGAHGVAPSRSSLSRRVRRVLDAGLPRTPAARGFAAGMLVGAMLLAAPLAALTVVPARAEAPTRPVSLAATAPDRLASAGVAGSVATAAAMTGATLDTPSAPIERGDAFGDRLAAAIEARMAAVEALDRVERVERSAPAARPGPLPVPPGGWGAAPPPLPAELPRPVSSGRAPFTVTPARAAEVRAAARGIALDAGDQEALLAVGATPGWIRAILGAGLGARSGDDLVEARAVGLEAAYVAAMAAAGLRGTGVDDLVALRALGIGPADVRALRARGIARPTADQLTEARVTGHVSRALRRGAPPGPDDPDDEADPDGTPAR